MQSAMLYTPDEDEPCVAFKPDPCVGHVHGLIAVVQLYLSVMQEEDESSEEAPVQPAKKGRGSNTAKR